MLHRAQLQTFGGWGNPVSPALAFDLSKAAAWKQGAISGLRRYGKTPGIADDDTRPIAPDFRHTGFTTAQLAGVTNIVGGTAAAAFREIAPSLWSGAPGITFNNATALYSHAFGMPFTLAANESFAFQGEVFKIDGAGSEAKGHVWWLRIGGAGTGIILQIRDGRPEIARMASTWTRSNEQQLQLLWALNSPTTTETATMATLEKSLYEKLDSLSFEYSTGRDEWLGQPFTITLVPEPRGVLHLVLKAGDAVAIEFRSILDTRGLGNIWGTASAVEVGATGGAWIFQPRRVTFGTGLMSFGPYVDSYLSDDWNNALFSASAFTQGGAGTVTLEREIVDAAHFKLNATFDSSDARFPAWLYGLSARIENGERSGLTVTTYSLDTDNLAAPNSDLNADLGPILDVNFECREDGKRTATVHLRDVAGRTSENISGGLDGMIGRVCDVSVTTNGVTANAFRQALITRGRWDNCARLAYLTGGTLRRLGIDIARNETQLELTIADGWHRLEEVLCKAAPPIGDGRRLGDVLRSALRLAGFSTAEMAGVSSTAGPLLPTAAPGEDWAIVADKNASVASFIDGLLDRFGLGYRFYQNHNGVWVLEIVPTTILENFTSIAANNDPNLSHGGTRAVILEPLVWERDNENYYNDFTVIGGADGHEITISSGDTTSQNNLGTGVNAHALWAGRTKSYPDLRDSGLRDAASVFYALQSLKFRYGKPGRLATFESYFVRNFLNGDRVTCDGILCEIVSWSASIAADRMQITVREI